MANETHGFSGQFGNVEAGDTPATVYELTDWKASPSQKLGEVVSNYTAGFTGQIPGAQSLSGTISVLVPYDATDCPFKFGPDGGAKLVLKADVDGAHSITCDTAHVKSTPISVGLGDEKGVTMEFEFAADGKITGTGMFDIFYDSAE